jgi:hypothetical protein
MLKRTIRYGLLALGLLSFYGCPDSWYDSYDYEGKEPFDAYALYELLSARSEGVVLVDDSLSLLREDTLQTSNYFFIGRYAYYGEQSVTELLDYVERGNTAFIAAYELPEDLASHLFGDECYYNIYYNQDRFPYLDLDSVSLQLNDGQDEYQLVNVYNHRPMPRPMFYLNDGLFCDEFLGNEDAWPAGLHLRQLRSSPLGGREFFLPFQSHFFDQLLPGRSGQVPIRRGYPGCPWSGSHLLG